MADQSASSGYGQMGPFDWGDRHNTTAFLVRQALGRIATVRLVVVKAVHAGAGTPPVAGTVDVQPLVNQVDGGGNATPHGTVYGLPYLRMGAGTTAVIVEPVAGDIGLCLVCDRDISSALKAKAPSSPGSQRRFSLADGVYLGALAAAAPDRYVQFTADGIKLADKNGHVLEMKADGTHVTGDFFVTGKITADGDVNSKAAVVAGLGGADQISLQTHKHGTGTPAAGTSVPTPGT